MKNASLGGRPLNRTSWIEVLPHLRELSTSDQSNGALGPYFRKPVSKIFVRITSATEAVELVLVDAAVSIQFLVDGGKQTTPVLQRPTLTAKKL